MINVLSYTSACFKLNLNSNLKRLYCEYGTSPLHIQTSFLLFTSLLSLLLPSSVLPQISTAYDSFIRLLTAEGVCEIAQWLSSYLMLNPGTGNQEEFWSCFWMTVKVRKTGHCLTISSVGGRMCVLLCVCLCVRGSEWLFEQTLQQD